MREPDLPILYIENAAAGRPIDLFLQGFNVSIW
jgi:hypothetical protein